MNNGPIAWTTKLPKTVQDFSFYRTQHYTEPLYTHPPQEPNCYGDGNVYRGVRSKDSEVQTIHIGVVRELTDEEIEQLAEECLFVKENMLCSSVLCSSVGGYYSFARAILRKAQER